MRRGRQRCKLRAKVFDTLRVLGQNHGRFVGKNELKKPVGTDDIVEEVALAQNLTVLRIPPKEDGQKYVETLAPMTALREEPMTGCAAPTTKYRSNRSSE